MLTRPGNAESTGPVSVSRHAAAGAGGDQARGGPRAETGPAATETCVGTAVAGAASGTASVETSRMGGRLAIAPIRKRLQTRQSSSAGAGAIGSRCSEGECRCVVP